MSISGGSSSRTGTLRGGGDDAVLAFILKLERRIDKVELHAVSCKRGLKSKCPEVCATIEKRDDIENQFLEHRQSICETKCETQFARFARVVMAIIKVSKVDYDLA
jgi:hypothetical protein